MRTKTGGKVVYRTFDGYHFWGYGEVFPDVDRETLLSSARDALNAQEGQPVIYEQGQPPIAIEKIECESCRRGLEREG